MKNKQTGIYADLHKHPGQLMGMVIRGEAKIVGKDRFGRLIYQVRTPKKGKTHE